MHWFRKKKKGYRGGWITTYTGKKVYPLELKPEDIDLKDIAWSLAQQVRYVGHGARFYSIAEHSILLASKIRHFMDAQPDVIPPYLPLATLLHDAAEAYLGDFPGPVKRVFPELIREEKLIQEKIWLKFNLNLTKEDKAKISDFDKIIVVDEMEKLNLDMYDSPLKQHFPAGLRVEVTGMDMWTARDKFLHMFRWLELVAKHGSDGDYQV